MSTSEHGSQEAAAENREMVVIDGSILEGGGQVLRIAVALSAIKRIPVRIENIRAKRKKPGLAQQHLKGLMLVRDLCNGELKNGQVGATEITFLPGKITAGSFTSTITTAGSIAMLMQIAIPCCLFAPGPSTLILQGGTDAEMAPPIDYVRLVTAKLFEKFGAKFETNVIKRGFFPKGGGEVHVQVENLLDGFKPANFIQTGKLESIIGSAIVGGSCPLKVGEELKDGAKSILMEKFGCKTEISVQQCPAFGAGSSLMIVGKSVSGCVYGASVIGNRKKSAFQQGQEAATELVLVNPEKSCVDSYAQDQIILPMALAKGTSTVICGPLTLHTQTAIEITKMLTKAVFEVEEISQDVVKITCHGDPPKK